MHEGSFGRQGSPVSERCRVTRIEFRRLSPCRKGLDPIYGKGLRVGVLCAPKEFSIYHVADDIEFIA